MCPAVGMRKPMLQHWGCSRPRGRHWQGAWVRAQLRATWGLSIYTWVCVLCMCVRKHVHMCVNVRVHAYAHVCVCMCMHVCASMCACV